MPNFLPAIPRPTEKKANSIGQRTNSSRVLKALAEDIWTLTLLLPGSTFEQLGLIPHALRGGGKVADTWYQPVLVGHPSPKGWRHIVFTEPAATAGLASGMGGIAMDYIAYPGTGVFKHGESFSIRIRHHIVKMPDAIQVDFIEELWEAFAEDLIG